MGYRVGVDVGGTFTDLICVTPAGEVVLDKTPTTLDDQSRGVMTGIGQLAEPHGCGGGVRRLPENPHPGACVGGFGCDQPARHAREEC